MSWRIDKAGDTYYMRPAVEREGMRTISFTKTGNGNIKMSRGYRETIVMQPEYALAVAAMITELASEMLRDKAVLDTP